MGLFDTGNKCLKCGAYRHELGDSAPDNGVWPEDSMACGDTDWECKATFHKSLVATIPGCCPMGTPEGGIGNGPVSQCSFNCVGGFLWDAIEMTCVGCPDNSYSIKPTTPVGTWSCMLVLMCAWEFNTIGWCGWRVLCLPARASTHRRMFGMRTVCQPHAVGGTRQLELAPARTHLLHQAFFKLAVQWWLQTQRCVKFMLC